jgi:hypothetical protein
VASATASSDWNAKDILLYGSVALGAYLLWRMFSKLKTVPDTLTAPLANLWVRLTQGPPMNVLGVVQFPDGTEISVNTLPIKTDSQGNVYTYAGGITYQLQPWVTDAAGAAVYPAVPVGT